MKGSRHEEIEAAVRVEQPTVCTRTWTGRSQPPEERREDWGSLRPTSAGARAEAF